MTLMTTVLQIPMRLSRMAVMSPMVWPTFRHLAYDLQCMTRYSSHFITKIKDLGRAFRGMVFRTLQLLFPLCKIWIDGGVAKHNQIYRSRCMLKI